jgi:hypothetical protein
VDVSAIGAIVTTYGTREVLASNAAAAERKAFAGAARRIAWKTVISRDVSAVRTLVDALRAIEFLVSNTGDA